VVLAGVATGLLVTHERPGPVVARVLLGLAAVAMGGQSVVGLRLRATTTYMTGALATALSDAMAGRRGTLAPALLQLGSLVGGAAGAGGLLAGPRWAAGLLPLVLVGSAALLLRNGDQAGPAGARLSEGVEQPESRY
jgi:hypothetical protein